MKNFKLFIATLFMGSSVLCQLPTIFATGGFETDEEWNDWVSEYTSDDNPGFFGDCSETGEAMNASSTLAPQGKKNYSVHNLADSDPFTAWIPEGDGIGESFEYNLVYLLGNGTLYICNGYQSSLKSWRENSRVKKFKIYKNGIPAFYVVLQDKTGEQEIQFPTNFLKSEEGNVPVLKFEIVEVYKGTKYEDVAVSDVFYLGCCFLGDTLISGLDEPTEIKSVKNEFSVISIDPETGKKFETQVQKTASQTHSFLIGISTQTKSITLTPGHLLYVKGYGFISLKELKFKLGLKDYEELAGKLELLIYDSETGKTVYETLQSVEPKEGRFETFTIQKLKDGESYIANGFVTKTY